jgi:hypothetical protein
MNGSELTSSILLGSGSGRDPEAGRRASLLPAGWPSRRGDDLPLRLATVRGLLMASRLPTISERGQAHLVHRVVAKGRSIASTTIGSGLHLHYRSALRGARTDRHDLNSGTGPLPRCPRRIYVTAPARDARRGTAGRLPAIVAKAARRDWFADCDPDDQIPRGSVPAAASTAPSRWRGRTDPCLGSAAGERLTSEPAVLAAGSRSSSRQRTSSLGEERHPVADTRRRAGTYSGLSASVTSHERTNVKPKQRTAVVCDRHQNTRAR